MIHHIHNTLLSDINNSNIGQKSNSASDQNNLENFRRALSTAREEIGGGTTQPAGNSTLTAGTYTHPSTSLPIPPAPKTDPLQTAAPAAPSAAASTPALDPQQTFDNNYWASQPAAVQALRTMQDPSERATAAAQLASEGYQIDMPIMVWGWDPSIVTSMRQAEGYTWVPSAMQNPVEMLPGLPSMGTLSAYNANNPPAGSIMVS